VAQSAHARGDVAGGGEIVASAETLGEAGEPTSDARETTVKGVTTPIKVATVGWT